MLFMIGRIGSFFRRWLVFFFRCILAIFMPRLIAARASLQAAQNLRLAGDYLSELQALRREFDAAQVDWGAKFQEMSEAYGRLSKLNNDRMNEIERLNDAILAEQHGRREDAEAYHNARASYEQEARRAAEREELSQDRIAGLQAELAETKHQLNIAKGEIECYLRAIELDQQYIQKVLEREKAEARNHAMRRGPSRNENDEPL